MANNISSRAKQIISFQEKPLWRTITTLRWDTVKKIFIMYAKSIWKALIWKIVPNEKNCVPISQENSLDCFYG